MKILIVDGDPFVSHSIQQLFKAVTGNELYSAETTEDALSLLEKNRNEVFDLMITELDLTNKNDGLMIIEQAHTISAGKTKIVLLSGSMTPTLAVQALKCGAFAAVDKFTGFLGEFYSLGLLKK